MKETGASRLHSCDDYWRLEHVLPKPTRVVLINDRTEHKIEIPTDSIKSFQSPQFLVLRCRICVFDDKIEFQPIDTGNPNNVVLPTLYSVIDAIRSAPLALQDEVAKSYLGTRVTCTATLFSIHPIEGNSFRVGLVLDDFYGDCYFEVGRDEYPQLLVVHRDHKMRITVRGRYAGSEDLVECEIEF